MNNNKQHREIAELAYNLHILRMNILSMDDTAIKKETNSIVFNKILELRKRRFDLQQYIAMLTPCTPVDYRALEELEKEVDALGGKIAAFRFLKGFSTLNIFDDK